MLPAYTVALNLDCYPSQGLGYDDRLRDADRDPSCPATESLIAMGQ